SGAVIGRAYSEALPHLVVIGKRTFRSDAMRVGHRSKRHGAGRDRRQDAGIDDMYAGQSWNAAPQIRVKSSRRAPHWKTTSTSMSSAWIVEAQLHRNGNRSEITSQSEELLNDCSGNTPGERTDFSLNAETSYTCFRP